MKVATTYAAVRTRYVAQVAEIVAALRKGKSKERGAAPEDLTWAFEAYESVPALSFEQLSRDPAIREEVEASVKRQTTPHEQAAARVCATRVALVAKRNRWWGRAALPDVPDEVCTAYVDHARALVESTEQADVGALIDQLTAGGGFVVLGLDVAEAADRSAVDDFMASLGVRPPGGRRR